MSVDCPILDWHGCYDGNWNGLIVPEAFRHPAKFAPGLVDRIYRHGLANGWWSAGDIIGDPFGGIGGGGIIAAAHRLRWIGVEIEPRFVALAQQNFHLHAKAWEQFGDPYPIIVQGDARLFAAAAILAAAATAGMPGIVTSAPYGEGLGKGGGKNLTAGRGDTEYIQSMFTQYGSTKGQIGELPMGKVDAVITSPPYANSVNRKDGHGFDWSKGVQFEARPKSAQRHYEKLAEKTHYGETEGQIGALRPGNLDAVVTSPPWEDREGALNARKLKDPAKFAENMARRDGFGGRHSTTAKSRMAQLERQEASTYGESEGQIGNWVGETYWQAMAQVYRECFDALRPGGVMAVVMKDYVKDKRVVPLCHDTLTLLVRLGFKPVLRARAHIVKERSENTFGGVVTTRTERKSFFRRLAESKGSPRIDWEEVICVRRPT